MKRVNSPRVKILFDIYHAQIMDGDVVRTIRDHIGLISHFHTGGNPGRNDIDETQELNYRYVMQEIADRNPRSRAWPPHGTHPRTACRVVRRP